MSLNVRELNNEEVGRSQSYLRTYIDTLDTYIDPSDYDPVMRALDTFFKNEGFTEVCAQNRFSILSACEDVFNISSMEYCGKKWPNPQSSQLWLEWDLLTRPDLHGVFCRTTSYREEKKIVQGRHFVCFPLFEFESRGNFSDLLELLTRLVKFLGYSDPVHLDYTTVANQYGTKELEHEHEARMCEENGPVCFLKDFPEFTHPFWNMARDGTGIAKKVDVILSGHESIGCAERSCDIEQMREIFYTICDGEYHKAIFEKFGQDRTEKELEAFLKLQMCNRFGAGLGVTRLINSLKKEGLMEQLKYRFGTTKQ